MSWDNCCVIRVIGDWLCAGYMVTAWRCLIHPNTRGKKRVAPGALLFWLCAVRFICHTLTHYQHCYSLSIVGYWFISILPFIFCCIKWVCLPVLVVLSDLNLFYGIAVSHQCNAIIDDNTISITLFHGMSASSLLTILDKSNNKTKWGSKQHYPFSLKCFLTF